MSRVCGVVLLASCLQGVALAQLAPAEVPVSMASAATSGTPAELPAAVRALDGQLALAQGKGYVVRLQDLREAASEFVSAGEQARFWHTPHLMQDMVSSLYRQQVLAASARTAGLALPPEAGTLTPVQTARELGNLYLRQEAEKRMPSATAIERYAKAQYAQNAANYTHGEMFQASHILVAVQEAERTEEQAKARAQTVIDRLARGEDFGALATELSDDRDSRNEKGSLSYREAKELPEDFVAVLQTMQVGSQSTLPVRTKAGYHVIWLQGKRPAGRLNFDDLRDQLMTQASAQLAARATRTVWDEAVAGMELNQVHLDQVVAAMRAGS